MHVCVYVFMYVKAIFMRFILDSAYESEDDEKDSSSEFSELEEVDDDQVILAMSFLKRKGARAQR